MFIKRGFLKKKKLEARGGAPTKNKMIQEGKTVVLIRGRWILGSERREEANEAYFNQEIVMKRQ